MKLSLSKPIARGLYAAVLIAARVSVLWGAEAENTPRAATRNGSETSAGRLTVEGRAIQQLTLVDERGRATRITRPGGSVSLPAGKYYVQLVALRGGFVCQAYAQSEDDWIHVAMGRSPVLKAGAPLTPRVRVQRTGRLLAIGYELVDAAGRNYTCSEPGGIPPKFTVRKHGQTIASGSFKYG